MLLLVSALFIGVALSLRHNVFILIPASIASAGAILTAGIADHDSFWTIVFVTTSTVIALQTGYLIGIGIVPLTGEYRNVASISENAPASANVVHFHNYWSAKTH